MSERGDRRSVTVDIAGERHVLRSDASIEYTQSVAAHVDSTIRSLGLGTTLEPHRAAILAALTITDELFRARRELEALREEIVRRSSRLAYLLERATEPAREPEESPSVVERQAAETPTSHT
jgi:cell division protein ZapA